MTSAPTPRPGREAKPRLAATARRAVLAGIALGVLLTGCTATTPGHPAAAGDLGRWQPAAILPQHLVDLLLKEDDVNTIGHTSAMAVRKPLDKMWHDEDVVSNTKCLDIYSPAQATVYQASNWNAVQGQLLDDGDPPHGPKHALIQDLISFRDADSAQQFFAQAKTRWSGCVNQTLILAAPGRAPIIWNFGALQETPTTLSDTQTQANTAGFSCQRAMGLVNNVIIDTLWCGHDTTTQASDVVAKTTTAVTQA